MVAAYWQPYTVLAVRFCLSNIGCHSLATGCWRTRCVWLCMQCLGERMKIYGRVDSAMRRETAWGEYIWRVSTGGGGVTVVVVSYSITSGIYRCDFLIHRVNALSRFDNSAFVRLMQIDVLPASSCGVSISDATWLMTRVLIIVSRHLGTGWLGWVDMRWRHEWKIWPDFFWSLINIIILLHGPWCGHQ